MPLYCRNIAAIRLILFLVIVNLIVWVCAFICFRQHPDMIALAFIAWGYGLRHAVDADHLAAIDNVTRKLMQQKTATFCVGAFFSLGHSSIVVLASLVLILSSASLHAHLDWLRLHGSLAGTLVSSFFLLIVAFANLSVLRTLCRTPASDMPPDLISADSKPTGPLSKVLNAIYGLVNKSWHMYLVGFLFGLGFDTATEVGLLGISATAGKTLFSAWSVMLYPLLFTSAMTLIDSLDSLMVTGIYQWAVSMPGRKLTFNKAITAISALLALVVGAAEALNLWAGRVNIQGTFWEVVSYVNTHMGTVGMTILLLLPVTWGIAWSYSVLKNA